MNGGPHYITKEEYRLAAGVSTSTLKAFAECPEGKQPKKQTDSMLFGSRLERLCFSGFNHYAIQPEEIKVRRGKEWDAFVAAHPGEDILTLAEFSGLCFAHKQLRECRIACGLLDSGQPWPSFFWDCPVTGLRRKAELDVLGPRCIVDLKTAADVTANGFARDAERFRYHWQAASYRQAVQMCTGSRLPVVFVCVKNSDPFNVEVYEMAEDWIDDGEEEVTACLKRYKQAGETDVWRTPTWGTIVQLGRPRYAKYQQEYQLEEV